MADKHLVVAGVSGVIGYAAAKHFSAQPGVRVTGISRRSVPGLDKVQMLNLDLLDAQSSAPAVASLRDVTHVIYAALFEKPGLVSHWRDQDYVERNTEMFRNFFDPISASPTLQHVTLLQGTKAYGSQAIGQPRWPAKERWPRIEHSNFYFTQEDLLREKQSGRDWTWTIFRPQAVVGEAYGVNMNLIPALGAYGAILKERGEPLHYPGGGHLYTEAIDAEILADAIDWAGSSAVAANEIYNITNGDVFSLRNCWPVIADALGMQPGEDRPMSLGKEMPGYESDWARIVDRYDLRSPRSLAEFVGQSFIIADVYLGPDRREMQEPILVSTIKLRKAGFLEFIDTEDMFRKYFERYQSARLLPPR